MTNDHISDEYKEGNKKTQNFDDNQINNEILNKMNDYNKGSSLVIDRKMVIGLKQDMADLADAADNKIINKKALEAITRITYKLLGKDFNPNIVLEVDDQVERLIREATSHENICQSYLGWNPFL